MKKLILTIVVAVITFGGYYLMTRPPVVEPNNQIITSTTNQNTTESNQTTEEQYLGYITILVVDELGETIINNTFGYIAGDTLFTILDENYTLGCADTSYNLSDVCEPLTIGSRVLLKIDDVVTDWTSSYIGIYVDDVYSVKGLDLIELVDGSTYRFEYKGL